MEVYFPDGSEFLSNRQLDELLMIRTAELERERERLRIARTRATLASKEAQTERERAERAEAEIARLRALLGDAAP